MEWLICFVPDGFDVVAMQEILDVEQVTEESQGLALTEENVDQVGTQP